MSKPEDEPLSDEDIDENVNDPSYILSNLDIAGLDCFDDESCMNAARLSAANIISQQMAYYVSCILHGFKHRQVPAAPNILVYGGGFVGKRVIETLVDNKCGSMLYVYSRGDLRAKYWRSAGLRSSPSLTRLLKGEKVDVAIILSGMSAFQSLTKQLIPHMTRATCVLSSSLGLERKRIFALFRTPGVFRTYVEAATMVEQIKENEPLAWRLKGGRLGAQHGRIPPTEYEKPPPAEGEGEKAKSSTEGGAATSTGAGIDAHNMDSDGQNEADAAASPRSNLEDMEEMQSPGASWAEDMGGGTDSLGGNTSLVNTVLDSIFTFRLDPQILFKDTVEGSLEHAADLIATRQKSMLDLISVLENYYSVLGIPHRKARAAALYATLGYTPEGYAEVCAGNDDDESIASQRSRASAASEGDVLRNILKAVKVASYPALIEGIAAMEDNIALAFRRQFSKYIKVVDIPRVESLGLGAKPKDEAERKKAKLAKMKGHKNNSEQAPSSGLMNVMSGAFNNEKAGDGEVRDDVANDMDAEEKSHVMAHGQPIHSDKILRKIFTYDLKLTGRAAMVAKSLDDYSVDNDDDDATIATHMSQGTIASQTSKGEAPSIKMMPEPEFISAPVLTPPLSAPELATDFPVVPMEEPRMMANPVASAQVEADAEMQLLMFLEEEAVRKEARATRSK